MPHQGTNRNSCHAPPAFIEIKKTNKQKNHRRTTSTPASSMSAVKAAHSISNHHGIMAVTQSAIDQPTYLQIRHFTFRGYFPSVNRHDITLSPFYYQDFFQKCPTAAGYCAFFLSRNLPEILASGAAAEGVLWLFAVMLIRFCSCLPFFTENRLIYWEIGRPIGNIAGCCEFFSQRKLDHN